jgi:dihydroorotase
MNILIKAATILDPTSPFHKKQLDIYIQQGVIKEIGKNLSYPKAKQLAVKNLHISQGWFDSSVSFGEPGYEERETIDNGLQVAALSGFTHIAYNTNTTPKPDSRADISFLLELANGHVTQLHPKACITTTTDKLAPLRELHAAGAVSFSNHKQSISNANALKLALQYSNDFEGLVESFAFDKDLANEGIMHEGAVSTALGLNGIPAVVEEVQLKRDLGILEYALGKLHTPTLSSSASVKLIKEAKKLGLDVSCSVSIFNLFFTDEALQGFNPNAKLLPPLRRIDDQKSLKKALADGTIDMVTSDHQPLNSELKDMELDRAQFGSIGLEHSFGSLLRHFSIEEAAEILTRGKARFGIEEHPIDVGAVADLSLFTDEGTTEVSKSSIPTSSKNSLFIGETLSGKVLGVIRGDKYFFQEN